MLKKTLLLMFTCLTLAVAGCGDDDKDSDKSDAGGDKPAATTGGSGTPEVEKAGPNKVDMKDIKYNPQNIGVSKGDTITWTNSDQVPHTVTKDGGPGPNFDSGDIAAGKTYEQTFDTVGKIDYHCTIHPQQTGTIEVIDTAKE